MTEQEESTEILGIKRKLSYVLIGLSLLNFITYYVNTGLEGNYTDFVDSIAHWTVPLGSLLWGLILGTPLSLIPFRNYTYKNKYLLTVCSISILFNLLFFGIGISLLFE